MDEKIVIDEGIKDTLEILRANPSLFTTKDYFHALPMDYANDPIYAIMQAAVMFDSKMTLTLLFDEFTNKNAKSEFSNKKFKQLYDAALKANQTKGVDENVIRYAPYLAFVYAYAQIVETKEGLTKEENDQLLSEFMQKLKDDSFVSAFYKQEEETEVLDNHHPAYSFVSAFKKFGENVYSDPACYGLFKRKETEAVLNQYLDDAYALYNPNEDKSDFAFFRRFKVTDENASFLKEYDCHDYSDALLIKNKGDLRAAILDAVYKHPIYERSNYNFSYIKTAMSLISDNFEEIVEIYNRKNKEKIDIESTNIVEKDKEEFALACKMFVSSYVVTLFAKKQKKGEKECDPFRILDPNLKVNLMRANDRIFEIGRKTLDDNQINEFVLKLEKISIDMANLIENTNEFTLPNISARTITRLFLKHLERQQAVYIRDINELEKVKAHKDNGKKFKSDEVVLLDCCKKYADGEKLDVDKLIKQVNAQYKNFTVARYQFLKPKVYGDLGRCISVYSMESSPEVVKNFFANKLDELVEQTLDNCKCDNEKVRKLYHDIFNESLLFAPIVEKRVFESLLKSMETYKLPIVATFKYHLTPSLMMSPKKNPKARRMIEEITTQESLSLNRKFLVKDMITQTLEDLALELKEFGDDYASANKLEKVAAELKDVMPNEEKKAVKDELKDIYKNLSKDVKENANIACQDLVRHIPALLTKIPTNKNLAKINFVEFICDLNSDNAELQELLKIKIRNVSEKDKAQYKQYVPEKFNVEFERLWNEIPKSTEKTKEKNVFLCNLRNMIKTMNTKERDEYMHYFNILFPTKKNQIAVQNEKEENELKKYKEFAKAKLVDLINHNQDIEGAVEMQETLDNIGEKE